MTALTLLWLFLGLNSIFLLIYLFVRFRTPMLGIPYKTKQMVDYLWDAYNDIEEYKKDPTDKNVILATELYFLYKSTFYHLTNIMNSYELSSHLINMINKDSNILKSKVTPDTLMTDWNEIESLCYEVLEELEIEGTTEDEDLYSLYDEFEDGFAYEWQHVKESPKVREIDRLLRPLLKLAVLKKGIPLKELQIEAVKK